MNEKILDNTELSDVYVMFWRLVQLAVHRYGSHPTGELLIVLTIMLLDQAGHNPTVTELADITNLPKSSVSRYVSTEMSAGFLEEVIDPRDRRRRLLRPTKRALDEQNWHREQVLEIASRQRAALEGLGQSANPGTDLKDLLQDLAKTA
ncbi:MAG: MarR family transcriptional regulator [Gammaproteobacteria bacterium]